MKGAHQALVPSLVALTIFLLGLTSGGPAALPPAERAPTVAPLDPTLVVEATAFAVAPPTVESLGVEAMADGRTAEFEVDDHGHADIDTPIPPPSDAAVPARPVPSFTPMADPDDKPVEAVASLPTPPLATPLRTPDAAGLRPVAVLPPVGSDPGGARALRVPILMYHYLSIPPPNADRVRLDLSVAPGMFEQQLAYLKENGYSTISLGDLYDALAGGKALPGKPVILTFDDGYRDAYENALPLLKKFGMRATFFIVTDFIHAGHPAYLTWSMVQAMHDAGMSIENHTRSHPDLRRRGDDFLIWQMLGAIESIEAYTGRRPQFFCYPGGFFDDNTVRVARSANILAAVTTQYGKTHSLDDAMLWSRVRVRGEATLRDFTDLVR